MHYLLEPAGSLLPELPLPSLPSAYLVRAALHACEVREAHDLRRAVFCCEQGLFLQDDRDAIDAQAQLLVAMSCAAGMPQQVVGTVRIHQSAPGVWWGSRLAVHAAFRSVGRIGATLIRLAVGRAQAQGCQQFWAHVQPQNVPLFEKLHWHMYDTVPVHGRPHALMQAELPYYPACRDAVSGIVTCHGARP